MNKTKPPSPPRNFILEEIAAHCFIFMVVITGGAVVVGAAVIGVASATLGWEYLWLAAPWGFVCWLMSLIARALYWFITRGDNI